MLNDYKHSGFYRHVPHALTLKISLQRIFICFLLHSKYGLFPRTALTDRFLQYGRTASYVRCLKQNSDLMQPSQSYHIISVLIINCIITLLHCILRTVRFPSLQTVLFFSLYLFLSMTQIIFDSYKSKTMPKFHNITTVHESVFGFDSIKV